MSDAVILGVAGIAVSGVIGPGIAAWFSHRADRTRFRRDQVSQRRDQLRCLLDDAAGLLASGPTNLRLLRESAPGSSDHDRASQWLRDVFPIGRRLQLWLPANHAVVVAYDHMRRELVTTAQATDSTSIDASLERFEALRDQFFDQARIVLFAPITAKGGPL